MTASTNGHQSITTIQPTKDDDVPELSDIEDEKVTEIAGGPTQITTKEYRGLKRDDTRKWLAIVAVAHLFVLESLSIYALWGEPELTDRMNLLITTASGVTGVVLGFYFGQSDD